MKNIIIYLPVIVFLTTLFSCNQVEEEQAQNFDWITERPFFEARGEGSFDNEAVKDPSIVEADGKYHLFYTAKASKVVDGKKKFSIATAYAGAETLEGLNTSERVIIDSIVGGNVVAPQVFYFKPQEQWYLVAHTWVEGSHSNLEPIYMTNSNINDVNAWSEIKFIEHNKDKSEFWIDFWMISQGDDMFMFYSNQQGSIKYLKTSIAEFPKGFEDSEEYTALTQTGNRDSIKWKMFEAAHIYHAKKEDKYIAILEGAWPHPKNDWEVDARTRFIFAMTADSLSGKWQRLEKDESKFLAEAKNIYYKDGNKTEFSLVSHPELIRAGNNQKLEIESIENIEMVYQSFNKEGIPNTYNYNELPFKLSLMRRK
ncbi:MAG: non-reducing end alpha-L-arabinofuranosidase family hydrolase [Bacteroidota bacterium]